MRSSLIALLALAVLPASAGAITHPATVGRTAGNFDVRAVGIVGPQNPAAVARLRAQLGAGSLVSVDPATGGLRQVGRIDGFLTGPSQADRASIAIGYVRANRAAFGLTTTDIDDLVLVRQVQSGDGLLRLFWQQRAGGVPALGSGLRANFTADGRLIDLAGSPVSGISSVPVATRLTAGQARFAAYASAGAAATPSIARPSRSARQTTRFANGDRAALGVLAGATKRIVWDTTVRVDGGHTYRTLVDASTGKTLYRRNLVDNATGLAHRNFPDATNGGTQEPVDFTALGWMAASSSTLAGPNVHVWSDVDDNDTAASSEEVGPNSGANFNYPLTATTAFGAPCGAPFTCTWNPKTSTTAGNTKLTNRQQNGTQVFFFVNNFHDWLGKAPISFTAANGAFQATDPVLAQNDDGANTSENLAAAGNPPFIVSPDTNHIDNANMATPPDGQSPTMQMYLFHLSRFPFDLFANGGDPFLPSNGGDEADIVYHEYTHGLSNRLIVDSTGNSTILSEQAASMGEAWSDWYAMDYLADPQSCAPAACLPDIAGPNEVVGGYVSNGTVGTDSIRTQAIDCTVGVVNALCASPGAGVPAGGGYTYADFGKILGFPEVHADGEIWGQTLWQIRTALGAPTARLLITRAMELSPDDPSYLDMRNAILQADTAFNAGHARGTLWTIFAQRGMGYFAGSLGSADLKPVADFSLPPAPTAAKGTVSGTVVDVNTHAPVAGARVGLPGLDSGFAGNPGATTAGTGRYALPPTFAHLYPYFMASGAGYEPAIAKPFNLLAGAQVRNFENRRGWALVSGGGRITTFTGADFTSSGCGPQGAIDGSEGSGWGSDAPGRAITVRLPARVDVTDFAVDPGAVCGDATTANTKGFTIETSPDGVTFTQAASGAFAQNQGGKMNTVVPTGGKANVLFVRFTITSNFADPGGFADLSELAVHGIRIAPVTASIAGPAFIELGRTGTFTSAGSQGVDGSPIVAQTWASPGTPTSAAPTYRVRGVHVGNLPVTLVLRDFAGRTGSVTKTFVVKDTLGPVVTLRTRGSRVRKRVTISGTVADPSGVNSRITVKFGDRKSATVTVRGGKFSVRHTYRLRKTFTIVLTAKDAGGRATRVTKKLRIR
jgi:hypothetical protein